MVKHAAFTLLELVFAIVIISISVLSLPMMKQVLAKNTESSLVQEAIFAASTELQQVTSYNWDENSMDTNSSLSRVVWTSPTDCNTTTKLRPGHIKQMYHRRCSDDSTLRPSALGSDSADLDDLDDINTTTSALFVNAIPAKNGYKSAYNSTLNISYADFGNETATNKNIKRIRITISDSISGTTITKLDTFSSNIGEIDYYIRYYQ